MIRRYIYQLSQFLFAVCLTCTLMGCSEAIRDFFSGDIAEGDEVTFTTALPSAPTTRSAKSDYETEMEAYKAVNEEYEFTVEMYQSDGTSIGTGTYQPVTDDAVGTLASKEGETPLYWPSTTVAYGFKAVAGSETLESDQSTQPKWLLQDRLEGYGYIKKWEGEEENGHAIDNLNALNYRTAKEWRNLNKEVELMSNEDDYKKIPLYLQHKRSLVTIILKAGEGVSRKALAYDVAENDLSAVIYSYAGSPATPQSITPLATEAFMDYEADKNGAAETHVSTTRYDAIVEPFDYSENPSTDQIAKISLSFSLNPRI